MASGILEYSTTPSSNTAINGIGIAGSNSIKNGDDAMRQIMADAKAAVTQIVDKAAGSYTAAKSDHNQLWRVTGAATINLTAAATLTAGWCLWVMADGATATIDPASSEQINGASTLSLEDGNSALIICTSTEFRAVIFNKPFDSDTLGGAALLDVGTTAGTVAAGDDSRITGAVQKATTSTSGFGFVIDEDDMASDSATKVPTQQSVKAYADAINSWPGVYTGSDAAETNFPVGTYRYVNSPGGVERNAAAVIRLSSSSSTYAVDGVLATLAGTWRCAGNGLFQRVA